MMQEFRYKSPMQVPRLEKIVVNIGLGEAIQNIKLLESASGNWRHHRPETGGHPGQASIAAFKLREGMPIGCMVTLRRSRMYFFFDKLVNVVLPRVRDFRGLSEKSFDGRGNYTLGIREQIIFPEIDYDKIDKVKGMNITIVTSAPTDEEGKFVETYGNAFQKIRAERTMAKKSLISKAKRDSQVSGAEIQPLSPVRTSPGVFTAIRHLPHLFSQHGPTGRDPRGH
jgi:large subunit ribosomal protein L5